jgi:hypothetical protein
LGFLQTPSRDDALALLLAFGSAHTWHGDFHPVSSVPCLAHTLELSGGPHSTDARTTKKPVVWPVHSSDLLGAGTGRECRPWTPSLPDRLPYL